MPPSQQKTPPTGNVLAKMALLRGLDVQPAELAQLASTTASPAPARTTSSSKKSAKAPKTRKTAKSAKAPTPATTASPPSLLDIARGITSGAALEPLKTYGAALAQVSAQQLVAFGQSVAKLRTSLASEAQSALTKAQASPKSKTALAQVTKLAAVLPPIASAPMTKAVAAAQANSLPAILQQRAAMASSATDAFTYNAPVERVGWLDLERLEMYPAGIEHGELVHSVPLAPNQTVNITHREWTVTTQTFESLVSDSLDGFSETGVTDKTDLAQSVDTESKHTSSLDVNGSVSATYNGGAYSVTASSAVNFDQTSDQSQSLKDSVAHSMTTTRNASTRSKKEHKQSFRVSSVAGAEDLAVSIITNPSATNAMRVDYFQLLRKWQVDLIRYGVRMTYDIVIPNPGLDLITRSLEIQAIDEMLTTSTYTFGLNVIDVTPAKWLDLSQTYGVALDPPPAPTVPIASYKSLDQVGATMATGDVEIDVPDGYAFQDGKLTGELHSHAGASNQVMFESAVTGIVPTSGSPHDIAFSPDLAPSFQGQVGALIIPYSYQNSDSGSLTVTATASLLPQTLQTWQLKAWSALRDADQAAYQQRLQSAKDRKAYLQDQISQFDALTLRKMEREEIMRWVLRWLLGPGFDLMPKDLASLFQDYPSTTPAPPYVQKAYPDLSDPVMANAWPGVLSFGEFIKYIHDAVEWENVLFFAYPYFWDHSDNWPLKRFLLHPDPVHREFLRSGAMRVVLTIRPGFEQSFAMLQATGDSTAAPDPNSTPYVTVAQNIQDFAMTNYFGIPPANPDHNVRPLLYPLQQRAWADMQPIIQAIEDYAANQLAKTGVVSYPPSLSALPAGLGLNLTDPWNNPYHYKMPGDWGDYDLVCYGADGVPDSQSADPTNPLNADITNYAEGSIVARWYEYTPTSALDISINTVLPTTAVPA